MKRLLIIILFFIGFSSFAQQVTPFIGDRLFLNNSRTDTLWFKDYASYWKFINNHKKIYIKDTIETDILKLNGVNYKTITSQDSAWTRNNNSVYFKYPLDTLKFTDVLKMWTDYPSSGYLYTKYGNRSYTLSTYPISVLTTNSLSQEGLYIDLLADGLLNTRFAKTYTEEQQPIFYVDHTQWDSVLINKRYLINYVSTHSSVIDTSKAKGGVTTWIISKHLSDSIAKARTKDSTLWYRRYTKKIAPKDPTDSVTFPNITNSETTQYNTLNVDTAKGNYYRVSTLYAPAGLNMYYNSGTLGMQLASDGLLSLKNNHFNIENGRLNSTFDSTLTNAGQCVLRLGATTSGTSAAGYGGEVWFENEVANGKKQLMGKIQCKYQSSTPVNGAGGFVFSTKKGSGLQVSWTIDSTGNCTTPANINCVTLNGSTSVISPKFYGTSNTYYGISGAFSTFWGKNNAGTQISQMILSNGGKLLIGPNILDTIYDLNFTGTSNRIFGITRNTINNTIGVNLSNKAGGATLGATDKDGGINYIYPGLSTGMGKSSIRFMRYTRATSTATVKNDSTEALVITSEKPITNNVADSIFRVSCPDGAMIGINLFYSVTVSGTGPQLQVHTGHANISAVRIGSTVTSTIVDEAASDQANAFSTGTLAEAWSITTNVTGNWLTIKCNFNSNLTSPVLKIYYTLHNNSKQFITQL